MTPRSLLGQERIRAGGAGIGGLFTPTGFGTPLAEGKETRVIDGRGYILEQVSASGDLANWHTGRRDDIPAVGGAMDLAIGAKQTFVMMDLLARDGGPAERDYGFVELQQLATNHLIG